MDKKLFSASELPTFEKCLVEWAAQIKIPAGKEHKMPRTLFHFYRFGDWLQAAYPMNNPSEELPNEFKQLQTFSHRMRKLVDSGILAEWEATKTGASWRFGIKKEFSAKYLV